MGRRSWSSAFYRAARAQERHQRSKARHDEQLREAGLKQERQNYQNNRQDDATDKNSAVEACLAELGSLLTSALDRCLDVDFKELYRSIDTRGLDIAPSKPTLDDILNNPWGFFSRLLKGTVVNHEADRAAAQLRAQKLSKLQADVDEHNLQIDSFALAVRNAEPQALVSYAEMLLEQSPYPREFPQHFRVGIIPESQQLVIEYELPLLRDIIPERDQYRYVKASDQITSKPRPEKKRAAEYLDVVAQVTLRTVHELFAAPGLTPVQVVAFSGYVNGIDAGTGQPVKPHLISVRVSRSEFFQLQLKNVDPIACLKRMSASVSPRPAELHAVRPIVDFNMVDPRFIQEQDVLSTLDQRPDLMELTPSEFESLITNLFQQMGLETRLTQASRDGGVDCVAFDKRPVLGGKVVIQAKRYKNTVGVSAVRDLFGTLHNEGASKGILVTTSGFGSASVEFANGKPIELITGSELLFLLKQHAGIEARIGLPEDWVDPANDEVRNSSK